MIYYCQIMNPVTVIGAGQAGANLTKRLLERGIPVRLLDIGEKMQREHAQVPWGWFRKVSLQQRVRNPMNNDVDKDFKSAKHGAMILTTKLESKVNMWKYWLATNPDSTAKLLSASELGQKIGANMEGYWGFLCDHRDFLVDMQQLNYRLWEELKANPLCRLETGISAVRFTSAGIHLSNGEVIQNRTILAIGNRTNKVLPFYHPFLKTRLPWAWVKISKKGQLPMCLWNQNSSLQIYDDKVKLGCGSNAIFHSVSPWALPYFSNIAMSGLSNIYGPWTTDMQLITLAQKELNRFGIETEVIGEPCSCVVDLTPTFVPMVRTLGTGMVAVAGFSGSGFTSYETWFQDDVIDLLLTGKRHQRLNSYDKKSLHEHLNPTPEEQMFVFTNRMLLE